MAAVAAWVGEGVVGAVVLWFYKRFLRLRTGLRRIRWGRSSVVRGWGALAAGGRVGRLKVKVKPMVKSRRLRRALCNGG